MSCAMMKATRKSGITSVKILCVPVSLIRQRIGPIRERSCMLTIPDLETSAAPRRLRLTNGREDGPQGRGYRIGAKCVGDCMKLPLAQRTSSLKIILCGGNQIKGLIRIEFENCRLKRCLRSCLAAPHCTKPSNNSTFWWIASRNTPFTCWIPRAT